MADANAYDGMLLEFADATARFEMPEGVEFDDPVDPGKEKMPDGTMAAPSYESGYGVSIATSQWFCAWEAEWLRARESEPAAADAALEMLWTIEESDETALYWDESVHQVNRESLQKAELGDPTLIANDVDLNC